MHQLKDKIRDLIHQDYLKKYVPIKDHQIYAAAIKKMTNEP